VLLGTGVTIAIDPGVFVGEGGGARPSVGVAVGAILTAVFVGEGRGGIVGVVRGVRVGVGVWVRVTRPPAGVDVGSCCASDGIVAITPAYAAATPTRTISAIAPDMR
jgi:hypothetical protein